MRARLRLACWFDGHKDHNGRVELLGHETSGTGVRSEQGQSRTRPEA